MRFAVLSADGLFVDNVIVAKASQKEELEKGLGRTLMYADNLGLAIGDFYNGKAWTRNVEGEQVQLPLDDNAFVAEAIAILEGVIE